MTRHQTTPRRHAIPTASAEPARACPQLPGPAVKYAP
jgi:hypothetical protein